MKILYIDNFRGFESTFLSFEDVNFFVGENSTGKTSILKLLGIISSPGFWNYQYFTNNGNGFDSFNEIITINSLKQFFEIGILEVIDDNIFSAIKLRFIEENNIPKVKEICFLNEDINIQATIEGKYLKYRFETKKTLSINGQIFKDWIEKNCLNEKPFFRNEVEFLGMRSIFFLLQSFINNQFSTDNEGSPILKIKVPSFLTDLAWMAPIRPKPLKTYDNYNFSFTAEGTHTPYILKDILNEDDKSGVRFILKKFGLDSGLFDGIDINKLGDKSKKTEPFEILITLDGKPLNITNVGYGISQILPLLIEIIARPEDTWFAIQQPEIHLHPRAQAALGDFLYKSKSMDGQKFIIETHSDYTIDRYRLRINKHFFDDEKINKESKSQVVFFMRTDKGNVLSTIKINDDGSYENEQPKEFRDFFIKEQIQLITI